MACTQLNRSRAPIRLDHEPCEPLLSPPSVSGKAARNRLPAAPSIRIRCTRQPFHQAEYADVPRVLDELADRGYDVVRIDAFPQLDRHGSARPIG
jgi:hypothetical protein